MVPPHTPPFLSDVQGGLFVFSDSEGLCLKFKGKSRSYNLRLVHGSGTRTAGEQYGTCESKFHLTRDLRMRLRCPRDALISGENFLLDLFFAVPDRCPDASEQDDDHRYGDSNKCPRILNVNCQVVWERRRHRPGRGQKGTWLGGRVRSWVEDRMRSWLSR